MSTASSPPSPFLPKGVAALIHHVELHRDGWWDRSVQRLVLASIWLSEEPPTAQMILKSLEETFRLSLAPSKLDSVLELLERQNSLVRLPGDCFRIPAPKRAEFEAEIKTSERSEARAAEYFALLLKQAALPLDATETWTSFTNSFLGPLISEVGANAYRLVSGQSTVDGAGVVESFLKQYSREYQAKLNEVATQFLNPKVEEVRTYMSHLLHARLCVEASGLPADVINKIRDSAGQHIRFRVFVDTNFLFSLMDLHENPSNTTAKELQELIAHLKDKLRIDLYIAPQTIDEAKTAIIAAKSQLQGIPTSPNFTHVIQRVVLSGMAQKFLSQRTKDGRRLTSEEWFRPYLDDFVAIAKGKGIELFNEKQGSYSTRPDVVDDILQVLEFEKRLPEHRRKSYERVAHDMILWHFVHDKRSSYVESPIDARDWILTVDFRFIGFDQHKLRQHGTKVPICLHPTALVQLLQFWIPRTKEFEEAMLGSLRLPFLFQEFDAEAERTTLKILSGMGRFEGSSELPEETIAKVVMNEGLRTRLSGDHSGDEEITLIRDALLEEGRKRLELEEQRSRDLESVGRQKDAELSAMEKETLRRDEEIKRLADEVKSQQLLTERIREEKAAADAERAALKLRAESREALLKYLGGLVAIAAVAVIGALGLLWAMRPLILAIWMWWAAFALIVALGLIVGHLCLEIVYCRDGAMTTLTPFVLLKRFRTWLWGIVLGTIVLGVGGKLVANALQKELDGNSDRSSAPTAISVDQPAKSR